MGMVTQKNIKHFSSYLQLCTWLRMVIWYFCRIYLQLIIIMRVPRCLSPILPYSLLISQTLSRNLLNSPNSKKKCFCLNLFSRVTSNYICKREHAYCLSLLFGGLHFYISDRRPFPKTSDAVNIQSTP